MDGRPVGLLESDHALRMVRTPQELVCCAGLGGDSRFVEHCAGRVLSRGPGEPDGVEDDVPRATEDRSGGGRASHFRAVLDRRHEAGGFVELRGGSLLYLRRCVFHLLEVTYGRLA